MTPPMLCPTTASQPYLAAKPGDVIDESVDAVVLVRLVGVAVAAQVHCDGPVPFLELDHLLAPVCGRNTSRG